MIESYIPQIIDGLVSGNLNPGDVCRNIGMCEVDETTHLPDHTTTWWEGGKGGNTRVKCILIVSISPSL